MRPINADTLKIDSWKTVEDAIFDITHAPTMELSNKKYEKCMHYDTCKGSPVTMCGKRWSDEGCMKELPESNADHIRAMSDEELRDFILEKRENGTCFNDRCYVNDPNKGCDDCTLEWLKQAYKGEQR